MMTCAPLKKSPNCNDTDEQRQNGLDASLHQQQAVRHNLCNEHASRTTTKSCSLESPGLPTARGCCAAWSLFGIGACPGCSLRTNSSSEVQQSESTTERDCNGRGTQRQQASSKAALQATRCAHGSISELPSSKPRTANSLRCEFETVRRACLPAHNRSSTDKCVRNEREPHQIQGISDRSSPASKTRQTD